MRLKPGPQAQGWESEEAREKYRRNRGRGRIAFVCFGIILALFYGPVKLAPVSKQSDAELELVLSAESATYIKVKGFVSCDTDDCVSKRSENARILYEEAVLGRAATAEDPVPSKLEANAFAGSMCPAELRIVSDLPRIGEMTAKEAADSVRASSFVQIAGLLSRSEAERARREAMILCLEALEANPEELVEGITKESFRIPIPAKDTTVHPYAPPLEKHFPYLITSPARAAAVQAKNTLTSIAARLYTKIEPVAVELFGGSRVYRVETSLEVIPPVPIPESLEPKSTSEIALIDGALTTYLPLQNVEKIRLGVHPHNCPSAMPAAAGSLIISSAPGASTIGNHEQTYLALRISYIPLDYEMNLPQHSAYIVDPDLINHLNRQRNFKQLSSASFMSTLLASEGSVVDRAHALFFVLAQFFAVHGAMTFQLGFTLVSFSAVFSLRRLFRAETSSRIGPIPPAENPELKSSSLADDDEDDD